MSLVTVLKLSSRKYCDWACRSNQASSTVSEKTRRMVACTITATEMPQRTD